MMLMITIRHDIVVTNFFLRFHHSIEYHCECCLSLFLSMKYRYSTRKEKAIDMIDDDDDDNG